MYRIGVTDVFLVLRDTRWSAQVGVSQGREASDLLQVFNKSRSHAEHPTAHPVLNSFSCVCSLFLGRVMQFQNPVILYFKICLLQEYSETVVIYHFLNCVVMLGTFLGSCKSSAIWYCYSVLWGFLIKKKICDFDHSYSIS